MQIRITQAIHDALGRIGHVPDNLRARFDAIAPAENGSFTLALTEDDATALAELVQWHIRTDPATGKPTPETAPYQELILLIDKAMFA
ncbi:MAG TPA: hypothetical protein VNL98_03930 [Gemmatimonadales bacterium]|nr:hypothetical protein [Gemmatimonadales bacterium]